MTLVPTSQLEVLSYSYIGSIRKGTCRENLIYSVGSTYNWTSVST